MLAGLRRRAKDDLPRFAAPLGLAKRQRLRADEVTAPPAALLVKGLDISKTTRGSSAHVHHILMGRMVVASKHRASHQSNAYIFFRPLVGGLQLVTFGGSHDHRFSTQT